MYQIYCIAYRISDEMERQKAEEKPFWWEHLHAEVRDKPIEEIEKMLLDAGVPKEVVDGMDRKEKYLAVSEGCYAIDCEEYEKKMSGMDKTSFLNKNNAAQADMGNVGGNSPASTQTLSKGGSMEPLSMERPSEAEINTPPPMSDANDIDDDFIKTHANSISDDDLNDDFDKKKAMMNPFEGNVKPVGGGMAASSNNSVEIRKMAQSIVRETVNKINTKADGIPETISPQAEQDLLRAVVDELQSLR